MKVRQIDGQAQARRGAVRRPWIAVLLGSLVMAGAAQADDLKQCMSRMMERVDDSVTIGQLRLQCQKQLRDGSFSAAEKRADVISERVRQDKEHVLEPFTLMAHKPNYILVAAYNSSGYDPSLYRQQFDDPSLDVDDTAPAESCGRGDTRGLTEHVIANLQYRQPVDLGHLVTLGVDQLPGVLAPVGQPAGRGELAESHVGAESPATSPLSSMVSS